MQTITREQVYTALFNKLASTPGFKSCYRHYVPLDDLPSAKLPALMMRQNTETRHVNAPGQPAKYTITVDLLVICNTQASSKDVTPAAILNPLVDAVERSLDPGNTPGPAYATNDQTLGLPNVSRVWIEGEIEFAEAVQGSTDYSAAMIPVHMILT